MNYKVGILGLGYVGLPLAVEAGKQYPTIGFDISEKRIGELNSGIDRTLEVSAEELAAAKDLRYTSDARELAACNFFIVTVPTPIDQHKKPDLRPIIQASRTVAPHLKKGDVIVYESTVYPGCTEEVCVPVLEEGSGLKFNIDFYCGYSPERINPGDKVHRITSILKVTSGSTPKTADRVDAFYRSIIPAGTHKTSSIKVAEAAKVIENAQRDINIAFVNELAMIFERLGIDTREVLSAAGTKWNFLKFSPGLVGGHCIGVDPFYLTFKSESVGYHPEVILSGRRINDHMGAYVAQRTVKLLSREKEFKNDTRVLILGLTFKENCPDIRNSRVIDIYHELQEYGLNAEVYDPHAAKDEVLHEYGIQLLDAITPCDYKAIILAVAHEDFLSMDWEKIRGEVPVIFDVKGLLDKELVNSRL